MRRAAQRLGAAIGLALVALCGLVSCGEPSREWPAPSPALWEVSDERGRQAWLFGTIHALPRDVQWFTARLDAVLGQAEVLVVEIADLRDPAAGQRAYAEVASSPGLPPLLQRLPAEQRPALAAALDQAGLRESDFAATETWAAALLLANAARNGRRHENAHGVDRVLLTLGLPAIALEDFQSQFAIFDRLAEADQATLLHEAARDNLANRELALTEAWLTGDLAVLEREERDGLLADPELRQALLTDRNQAWVTRIAALIEQDRRPLVAVGAAHMIGPDGLPALLSARGYAVRRIQ